METKNLAESDGLAPLEWSRVDTEIQQRLEDWDPEAADRPTTWLTTINADGTPHVTSVGALWHAGSFWFQTGEHTRKARNVARDPHCSMSVTTRGLDVVIEGEAQRVTDPKQVSEAAALWAKGGWPAQPDESGTGITAPFNAPSVGPPPWFVYKITPRSATAVASLEPHGSTRWKF
jgi:general stress protein 26